MQTFANDKNKQIPNRTKIGEATETNARNLSFSKEITKLF